MRKRLTVDWYGRRFVDREDSVGERERNPYFCIARVSTTRFFLTFWRIFKISLRYITRKILKSNLFLLPFTLVIETQLYNSMMVRSSYNFGLRPERSPRVNSGYWFFQTSVVYKLHGRTANSVNCTYGIQTPGIQTPGLSNDVESFF